MPGVSKLQSREVGRSVGNDVVFVFVGASEVVGIGMVAVVGEPEEIEIEIDGAGESVGGMASPLQCAGVIPHQPNFEQHFPLAQIPLPRSPPPLPHVPSGLTMTSSSAVGVVVVVVVVVVVDCASLRDTANADSNATIALVANRRALMVRPQIVVLRLWGIHRFMVSALNCELCTVRTTIIICGVAFCP